MATQTFTKKSSVISIVCGDDLRTEQLINQVDETIPDYFYDNQVLEMLEEQEPNQRKFIFLGKDKTWEVTLIAEEFGSIRSVAGGLNMTGFTGDLSLP